MFVPLVAKPVTITNVSSATTVFADTFELGTFSPSVGSWSIGPSVTVVNSTIVPNPGAFQGSYYAQLFRDSNTANQGNLLAVPVSPQATNGNLIRLDMMVYLPSATDINVRAQFILNDGDFNTARAWVRPDGNGNVIAVGGPGPSLTDTGLNYSTDVWQRWELDYVIGSSTFDVSIDGVRATGFLSATSGQVSAASIFNGSNSPGAFYLDSAVPEPSATLLGAMGLIALLSKRTRNGRNG
jgi:hypothetical protein